MPAEKCVLIFPPSSQANSSPAQRLSPLTQHQVHEAVAKLACFLVLQNTLLPTPACCGPRCAQLVFPSSAIPQRTKALQTQKLATAVPAARTVSLRLTQDRQPAPQPPLLLQSSLRHPHFFNSFLCSSPTLFSPVLFHSHPNRHLHRQGILYEHLWKTSEEAIFDSQKHSAGARNPTLLLSCGQVGVTHVQGSTAAPAHIQEAPGNAFTHLRKPRVALLTTSPQTSLN